MPGSAAHTYGIAFTQCIAGPVRPISGCSPITGGCRPWNVHDTGGSASNSTSKRCSPSVHGGSRFSAHQPVHAHGHHRLAVDRALPREPLRGDRALLDHADRRVEVVGRDRHLVLRARSASSVQPSSAATMSIDCMNP